MAFDQACRNATLDASTPLPRLRAMIAAVVRAAFHFAKSTDAGCLGTVSDQTVGSRKEIPAKLGPIF